MYWKSMGDLLTNPIVEITRAKREKNLLKTISFLAFNWVLIAIGASVLLTSASPVPQALIFIGVLSGGIVFSLFKGVLVRIVMTTLGGRGNYFEGLTSVVYLEFPISIAVLLTGLLSVTSINGLVISLILSIVLFLIGIATFYRSIKEFFSVDIITAWIGVSILIMGIVAACYLTIFGFVVNDQSFIPWLSQY